MKKVLSRSSSGHPASKVAATPPECGRFVCTDRNDQTNGAFYFPLKLASWGQAEAHSRVHSVRLLSSNNSLFTKGHGGGSPRHCFISPSALCFPLNVLPFQRMHCGIYQMLRSICFVFTEGFQTPKFGTLRTGGSA